jgi:hypothetical protein
MGDDFGLTFPKIKGASKGLIFFDTITGLCITHGINLMMPNIQDIIMVVSFQFDLILVKFEKP